MAIARHTTESVEITKGGGGGGGRGGGGEGAGRRGGGEGGGLTHGTKSVIRHHYHHIPCCQEVPRILDVSTTVECPSMPPDHHSIGTTCVLQN